MSDKNSSSFSRRYLWSAQRNAGTAHLSSMNEKFSSTTISSRISWFATTRSLRVLKALRRYTKLPLVYSLVKKLPLGLLPLPRIMPIDCIWNCVGLAGRAVRGLHFVGHHRRDRSLVGPKCLWHFYNQGDVTVIFGFLDSRNFEVILRQLSTGITSHNDIIFIVDRWILICRISKNSAIFIKEARDIFSVWESWKPSWVRQGLHLVNELVLRSIHLPLLDMPVLIFLMKHALNI